MEFLAAIFSDLRLGLPSSFPWFSPKASLMLSSALLLISVWEEFSDQRSVKRFFAERSKKRRTSF